MISRVAILSPHGWFGQDDVLGRPDTGGQVVYVLDQVRALEGALLRSLRKAGLAEVQPTVAVVTRLIPENQGTTSDLPLEKIRDTRNSWILRVPFRTPEGRVHPGWLPRFEVWPFLEQFALEARDALLEHLGGAPDALIGNYSDGNLVASLLSEWTGVLQINIAHALEKSKYLFSDLYWREHEDAYRFSAQFTADLLAMNRADFIIASTLQEIVGTPTEMGQYESYVHFTMPGLYQVTGGIDLFHPKFNVIPPGVDERVFFPPRLRTAEDEELRRGVDGLLFHQQAADIVGHLEDPGRRPIFSISRLDRIKNLAGLLEAFGRNEYLKNRCNLILVTGTIDPDQAQDSGERAEIHRMYHLLEATHSQGSVRWLGRAMPRRVAGEAYRVIADRKGLFVQPALFEAFGLTVIEAMACGLPTFATKFGGPKEILAEEGSGYLLNPTRPDLLAQPIEAFVRRLEKDPGAWHSLSRGGLRRVETRYHWRLHAAELLKRIKLYGFWRYAVSVREKEDAFRYCDLLFHLLFKRQAAACHPGD